MTKEMTSTETTENTTETTTVDLNTIPEYIDRKGMNMKSLADQIDSLVHNLFTRVEELEKELKAEKSNPRNVRDRGPVSERQMTEEDAERVILGDLSDKSHRAAAEELGLSYGQVYSARNGYTFKGVNKKAEDLAKARATASQQS